MKTSRSSSRSTKRIKLDKASPNPIEGDDILVTRHSPTDLENEENSENCCTICLQRIVDRTVIPKCSHDFCFECLLVWTEQSRRCPLCSQSMGDYLIHSIRSRYDYRKYYLAPMRTSPSPRPVPNRVYVQNTRRVRRRHQGHVWGMRTRDTNEELDKLERSISKRRWIYEHDLYAKHVASNVFTKYRPYPTPAQFSASQDLISRTTTFLRRELQVWENLDVEFLTTLIISLMKSIDIRSESAVKLISEFLDMDETHFNRRNAEHFAHELYSYVRSPYKDLFVYDSVVQYDSPPGVSSPPNELHGRRWNLNDNRPSSPRPQRESAARSLRSPESDTHRRLRSLSRSPTRMNSYSTSPERSEGREIKLDATDPNSDEDRRRDSSEYGLQCSTDSLPKRTVSGASNAKGKERADLTAASVNTPSNPPTAGLLGSNAKMRLPRNRSLLESINAHLGRTTPHDVELAPTGSRSSLTKMSSRDHSALPLAPVSNQPENEHDSRLDPPNLCQERQNSSVDADMTLDFVEARARLLARLNREKRQAEPSTDAPRSSSFAQGQSSRSTTLSLPTNLEEREAKLRIQAQLRARVAAEKRLTEST